MLFGALLFLLAPLLHCLSGVAGTGDGFSSRSFTSVETSRVLRMQAFLTCFFDKSVASKVFLCVKLSPAPTWMSKYY